MELKLWLILSLVIGSVSTVIALPAPLTLEFAPKDLEDKEHVPQLLKVQETANEMLSKMKKIVQHPDEPFNDRILKTCFGVKYRVNLHLIQQSVDTLVRGTIRIGRVYSRPYDRDELAKIDLKNDELTFRIGYYEVDDHFKALALIHEATHVLLKSDDTFLGQNYTPKRDLADFDSDPFSKQLIIYGYLHRKFTFLRERAPTTTMIRNADTWLLFAHLASVGFVNCGRIPMKLWELKDVPISPRHSGSHSRLQAHSPVTSKPSSPPQENGKKVFGFGWISKIWRKLKP